MYQFGLERKGSSNIYILIPDLNWLRADTESRAWAGGTEVQPGKQWTRRNASKLLQCPQVTDTGTKTDTRVLSYESLDMVKNGVELDQCQACVF